jgi:hypothetical protein
MAHSYNYIDLTGQKIHRLTFLEFVDKTEGGNSRWKVRCDCGTEFIAISSNVKCGNSRSCGCYRDEMRRKKAEARRSEHKTK